MGAAVGNKESAGNILMFNNSRDAFAIAGKLLGHSLNPMTTQEIDAAAELLKTQKTVVQSYVMDEVFDKMGGEEAALAPYYVGDGVTMIARMKISVCLSPQRALTFMWMPCVSRRAAAIAKRPKCSSILCVRQRWRSPIQSLSATLRPTPRYRHFCRKKCAKRIDVSANGCVGASRHTRCCRMKSTAQWTLRGAMSAAMMQVAAAGSCPSFCLL